jgi:hypothetical protein
LERLYLEQGQLMLFEAFPTATVILANPQEEPSLACQRYQRTSINKSRSANNKLQRMRANPGKIE